jgi:hypothetical protein
MIKDKQIAKLLIKYVYNPTLVFFLYFSFVTLFGFYGKTLLLLFGIIFPWLFIFFLFFYTPLLQFLFKAHKMPRDTKINHVLEHGTIYFLKKSYSKKHKIGGHSLPEGFRIYGEIDSKNDIKKAFDHLETYLEKGKTAAVLSRFCGSSTHILEGFSFVILTITLLVFGFCDLTIDTIRLFLALNIVIYFLFRFPIGNYFQKKCVMYFNFSDPKINSIKKVTKKGLWERSPVYFVKTDYVV